MDSGERIQMLHGDLNLYARTRYNRHSSVMSVTFREIGLEEMTAARYNELYGVGIKNKLNSAPITYLSCAPDKSSVGSLSLGNTPFALEDNTAWWGCPQEPLETCMGSGGLVALETPTMTESGYFRAFPK